MTRVSGLNAIASFLLIFVGTISHAQGLYPVTIDEKVNHSSLIVEGKVIGKRSYWNAKHTMIYTANEIEVYKVFKGETAEKTIEITTVGGRVGDQLISATHYLELDLNEVGIFFCQKDINQPAPAVAKSYDVYSSTQGFYKYDLPTKTASTPFVKFDGIENDLYLQISKRTGKQPKIKTLKFSIEDAALPHSPDGKVIINNSTLAPAISSFTPATVSAGALTDAANNVLTINGSGFGTATGSAAIEFPNGDAAGAYYSVRATSNYIVSWSNTQIKVRVPDKAANGAFRVLDPSGTVATSPSALAVRFSILNANLGDDINDIRKEFHLAGPNGSGGFTIHYSTSTANNGQNIDASPAKQTFQRALTTWKEAVGVNIIEGATTTAQQLTGDDNNIVVYDNNGTGLPPLSSGVLATCYSYLNICPSATEAYKSGFDIVIRNPGVSSGSINFSLGPCPPYSSATAQVDLESVLLHELGHALNLAHINEPGEGSGPGTTNPSKVMHYSVSYNFKRTSLDVSALLGGKYAVTKRGISFGTCNGSVPEMEPLTNTIVDPLDDCPGTFPTAVTPIMTKASFDLAHATSNRFVDPGFTQFTLNGTGTSVTNNSYFVVRTNSTGGTLGIKVTNYATLPVAQAACTVSALGIPVTGVQLAIYKVSSCPAGQSYPSPIVYTTFAANGDLPVIDNLTANSNYLLVVDGVENTKATFGMELSGTALSSRFTSFTGEALAKANTLEWILGTNEDIASMALERSEDGVTYTKLDDISNFTELNGTYTDDTPLTGPNYYRLAITTTSGGDVQYSAVVELTRSQPALFNIFPNPVQRNRPITLRIRHADPGAYTLLIRNVYGQTVGVKQVNVTGSDQREPIYLNPYLPGAYHFSILDPNQKKLFTQMVVIP